MSGAITGRMPGMIISRCAAAVTSATHFPYSGLAVPSMIPGISRNWRRTSMTTSPAARPTASIARDPKRNGMMPPSSKPAMTGGAVRSNVTETRPAPCSVLLRMSV